MDDIAANYFDWLAERYDEESFEDQANSPI